MAGRAGAPDAAHAALRYHYRDLARSLADIGSIASGSLTRGLTHCNKPRVPAVGPTRLACTAPTGGGRPSYKRVSLNVRTLPGRPRMLAVPR